MILSYRLSANPVGVIEITGKGDRDRLELMNTLAEICTLEKRQRSPLIHEPL